MLCGSICYVLNNGLTQGSSDREAEEVSRCIIYKNECETENNPHSGIKHENMMEQVKAVTSLAGERRRRPKTMGSTALETQISNSRNKKILHTGVFQELYTGPGIFGT